MTLRIFKSFLTVLCAFSVLFLISGCVKDRDVYAESSDFASYPDYWNDFNSSHSTTDSSKNTTGETEIITGNTSIDNSLILETPSDDSSQTSSENNSSDENSNDGENTPSEEETNNTSSQEKFPAQGPIVLF